MGLGAWKLPGSGWTPPPFPSWPAAGLTILGPASGASRPPDSLASGLGEHYWKRYDHSPAGLSARLDVSDARVRSLGPFSLVSYRRQLTGLGRHPFRESSLATHLFQGRRALATFLVASNPTGAMALELDYTGYPVVDLEAARKFYNGPMRMGQPYHDVDYYGYWSNQSVFGVYLTDPSEDHLPRRGRSNGYVSFWVHSADQVEKYLRGHGCAFPHIPAINSAAGLDRQPGYDQLLATDSEGNAVIFTQYTGRPR